MPRTPTITKTSKVILVLPTNGSPYLWKNRVFQTRNKEGKQEVLQELRKVIRGCVEKGDATHLKIHPVFENRWRIADDLLMNDRGKGDIALYYNENGRNACCPNMACLQLERNPARVNEVCRANDGFLSWDDLRKIPLTPSRVPFFGELALVMPYTTLQKVVESEAMKLVRVEDSYAHMGVRVPKVPSSEEEYESYLGGYIFEPYDGEESKKFKAFAKEKGWFIGSMGMTYMCRRFLRSYGRKSAESPF